MRPGKAGRPMTDGGPLSFHHVGVAVQDVAKAADHFGRVFGAVVDTPVYHDLQQGVYIQFVKLGDLRIELLAPGAGQSPVDGMLKRGISIYHVCFEAEDFDARLNEWTSAGAQLVSSPKPAVAFGGRRVAFVMVQGLMIELVEGE